MSGFLENILAHKKEEIALARKQNSMEALRDRAMFSLPRRSFRAALSGKAPSFIAEVKKASPSKGVIRESFDHKEIAGQYVRGGAHALSVLTDEEFFQGSLSYLEDFRYRVQVPLLRKDFIVDSYQLLESRAFGADAVLLIAAALDSRHLAELYAEAHELGLDCLVEIHSERELDSVAGIREGILGVNNRDLSTFHTDIETSFRLRPFLPGDAITVSESGINAASDVRALAKCGYQAVLVGEMLMKSEKPQETLRHLIAESLSS